MAKLIGQDGKETEVVEFQMGSVPTDVLAVCNDGEFYVKATREGELFDVTDATRNLKAKDRDRTGALYAFRKCTKECFDHYVQFLSTRTKANFHQARRAFLS